MTFKVEIPLFYGFVLPPDFHVRPGWPLDFYVVINMTITNAEELLLDPLEVSHLAKSWLKIVLVSSYPTIWEKRD